MENKEERHEKTGVVVFRPKPQSDLHGEYKITYHARKRMKEIKKYINPETGTADFALMFTQDFIYNLLDNETLKEFQRNRVIPVNPSGLMVTLFWVQRLYTSYQFSKGFETFVDSFNNWKREYQEFIEKLEENERFIKRLARRAGDSVSLAEGLFEKLEAMVERKAKEANRKKKKLNTV